MCGISVLFDPRGRSDAVERLKALHAPIRHRGPDGEGIAFVSRGGEVRRFSSFEDPDHFPDVEIALAFRRLRVLDLTAAAEQPMISTDRSVVLLFNGEIYNFRALRRELAAGGYSFTSSGDTEVILAAYQRWGTDCFDRLDGMWAIVIVDLNRRKLIASRDRFGIKPLYWSIADERLLLASEAKQIVAAVGGTRANTFLIAKYLQGARLPNLYDTFFDGIEAVPAAHWFEIDIAQRPSRPTFRSYWSLPDILQKERASTYDEAVAATENALRSAVATHSVADVPLGSLLSGGLDSSIVTVLLAEERRRSGLTLPTFSFGFRDGFADSSELQYSDVVARAAGVQNFDTGFDGAWILRNVDRVVHAMEEPSLALAALAQHRVFELCRAHGMTVVLDGQGADELFGGYVYHERLFVMDRLRRRRWREGVAELSAIARRDERARILVAGSYLSGWLRAKVRGRIGTPTPWVAGTGVRREDMAAYADRGQDPSAFYRQVYWDIKWGNVRLILDYADKNAMSWSIEARVPYFDRAVVEMAMSLPDNFKVFRGERKRVLRDVGRRLLPTEITERRTRMGFGTPDRVLIGETLWPTIREEITDPSFMSLPIFERRSLVRLIDSFERGRQRDYGAMWRLWALSRWRQVFRASV